MVNLEFGNFLTKEMAQHSSSNRLTEIKAMVLVKQVQILKFNILLVF